MPETRKDILLAINAEFTSTGVDKAIRKLQELEVIVSRLRNLMGSGFQPGGVASRVVGQMTQQPERMAQATGLAADKQRTLNERVRDWSRQFSERGLEGI